MQKIKNALKIILLTFFIFTSIIAFIFTKLLFIKEEILYDQINFEYTIGDKTYVLNNRLTMMYSRNEELLNIKTFILDVDNPTYSFGFVYKNYDPNPDGGDSPLNDAEITRVLENKTDNKYNVPNELKLIKEFNLTAENGKKYYIKEYDNDIFRIYNQKNEFLGEYLSSKDNYDLEKIIELYSDEDIHCFQIDDYFVFKSGKVYGQKYMRKYGSVYFRDGLSLNNITNTKVTEPFKTSCEKVLESGGYQKIKSFKDSKAWLEKMMNA